jgi:large subunit ribosomal protein L3
LAFQGSQGQKNARAIWESKKTIKNLEIVDIRPEENLILLKGAIPGSRSGLIEIKKTKVGKKA